ncbi:MAG TPA: RagB/SusD family nutrient uptake outer membrane protein, partial [Tissierellaceae bacterium]|nr:RagB/SusD family nutrient uptake outer membrane protein [Tissierellaceae bacterium]
MKENPHGSYTTDNYFSTESDALNALLYAYAPINYIEYGARFRFNIADVTTNQYTSYNKGLETGFYTWDINPNTEEFLYFFKYVYLSITRANAVLENVSTMNNIDPIVKEQFLGEAYFLRAFNYFMLVRTFGEVPLHEEVIKNMDMGQRSYASIETLYEFIISDLEEAISKMDIDKQPGRADKVAAQSLMSKVYLTMASSKMTGAPGYEWVSNYDEMYAKAAKYAGEVLYDQSTYGLEPDLLKIYDVEHQNDSIEHIFITSMSREGKGQEGSFSQLPQMYGIGGLQEIYISSSLDNKDDDV